MSVLIELPNHTSLAGTERRGQTSVIFFATKISMIWIGGMYLLIRVTWQNRTTPCLSKYSLVPSKYKCCHFQRHSESSVCSSPAMTCEMCSIMGNAISYRHGAASGRQAYPSRYTPCLYRVAAVDNDLSAQIGTLVWATPCLAKFAQALFRSLQ